MSTNIIGKPQDRVDGKLKVTGRAMYPGDCQNADVPYVDVHFINKPDTIFNPIGARGIGEIGITGMPAAIANAVYNATGRRVREFPILPEKLLPVGPVPAISMSGS
jgi:CO/xanthine dehydrogenase Mo-binding subunit